MGYYNSFVVKIWSNESKRAVRGHVQHVNSQEQVYFDSLKKATDFITSHLGQPPEDTGNKKGDSAN